MRTVMPWRGEFGLKIRYHVPAVYALEPPYRCVIEVGEEALYPGATHHVRVDRRFDDDRAGNPRRTDREFIDELRRSYTEPIEVGKGHPERRFVPEPHIRQDIEARVVICPRGRRYGASKNWDGWDALTSIPGVFAAGAPDSSLDVDCPRAWDHDRFLDASIEAIRSAKLVVATDAGLAHLAVLCGTPLLLITYRGLVAPGPVLREDGHVFEGRYWPVKIQEYYERANHMDTAIITTEAWESPDLVAKQVEALMRATR